jgi:hypothetical protein
MKGYYATIAESAPFEVSIDYARLGQRSFRYFSLTIAAAEFEAARKSSSAILSFRRQYDGERVGGARV